MRKDYKENQTKGTVPFVLKSNRGDSPFCFKIKQRGQSPLFCFYFCWCDVHYLRQTKIAETKFQMGTVPYLNFLYPFCKAYVALQLPDGGVIGVSSAVFLHGDPHRATPAVGQSQFKCAVALVGNTVSLNDRTFQSDSRSRFGDDGIAVIQFYSVISNAFLPIISHTVIGEQRKIVFDPINALGGFFKPPMAVCKSDCAFSISPAEAKVLLFTFCAAVKAVM